MYLLGAAVLITGLALPVLLQLYVRRLPVAPECPSCRATTRVADPQWNALQYVPLLVETYFGECTRCGWRGRMRLRWATRRLRDD